MATNKSVLTIGFDPALLDFSSPELAPMQLTAEKVMAGIGREAERIRSLGYDLDQCLIDLGETAESVVLAHLQRKQFDCVAFGAGIRTHAKYLLLFEKILNLVHEHAPRARICLNTSPTDTLEAIQRWT